MQYYDLLYSKQVFWQIARNSIGSLTKQDFSWAFIAPGRELVLNKTKLKSVFRMIKTNENK
jgi:hypothetical protein